mgnify:CR=1 FL=1|jgi:hypothetical protein
MSSSVAILAAGMRAVLLATALLASLAPSLAPLPTTAPTPLSITAVSSLNTTTNTWAISLNTGLTLQVELRAFDTGGAAPQVGAIDVFRDQGWLPIFGYYGYATFTQHGIAYHAMRS